MIKEDVKLFEMNLILAARSVFDVRALEEFVTNNPKKDEQINLKILLTIVQDGLKPNITGLKKWQIFKRLKLKKMFSDMYLVKNLTVQELNDLVLKVRVLEGYDPEKKKKPETKSVK